MSTIGSEVKHLEKEKQKTERKEHILVCLSFSPSNEKIIRTAAQMARAFGANFTALYVQTAEPAEKTPEDQARLQKHIRLWFLPEIRGCVSEHQSSAREFPRFLLDQSGKEDP